MRTGALLGATKDGTPVDSLGEGVKRITVNAFVDKMMLTKGHGIEQTSLGIEQTMPRGSRMAKLVGRKLRSMFITQSPL